MPHNSQVSGKVPFFLSMTKPLSEKELEDRVDARFTDHCSMISDDHFDFLDKKDKNPFYKLFTAHDPNIICDWLFNIKKIFVVEYDGNNNTYWSATYKTKYELDDLEYYENSFTQLKSKYNVFDKDNPLDFKEEGKMGGAAFMNTLYTPHTYVLDDGDSCNRTGNPPDTIENIFFGAYFFHKGMWCTSYIEGAHGRDRFKFYRDPPTNDFDFAPLQKALTQNKRETEFVKLRFGTPTVEYEAKFISRKFCVTEYFLKDERETAENTDCTLCGPCGPLREVVDATSVSVEYTIFVGSQESPTESYSFSYVVDLSFPSCAVSVENSTSGLFISVSENSDSCCTDPKLSLSYGGLNIFGFCGFGYITSDGLSNLSFPISNASFPVQITSVGAGEGEIGFCTTATIIVSVS